MLNAIPVTKSPHAGALQDRLLRKRETLAFSGHSNSTLYEEIQAGRFPKPVKIGKRAVAWRYSELLDWLNARVAERDKAA